MARIVRENPYKKRKRKELLSDLLTARQAAHYKGCSEKAVYEAIQSKRLPANRVGPVWLVSRKTMDAWVLVGHRISKKQKRPIVGAQETEPNGES